MTDRRAKLISKVFKTVTSRSRLGKAILYKTMTDAALNEFYDPAIGRQYGVNLRQKKELVRKFKLIDKKITTGTSWVGAVVMATEILKIPRKTKGDIIECGAWKGSSTARLSLVAKLVKRRLIVADSFQGLPEDEKIIHQYPHVGVFGFYKKGMYSTGLEEVKQNIAKYGEISVCKFLPGFFAESLKQLNKPIVFAFLDVDLATSIRDCIKHIWPQLIDGGYVFTDDSCDMEAVKVWFHEDFWKKQVGETPPGYVGSGCGLPINPNFSALGYARKISNPEKNYGRISWLVYPDDKLKRKKTTKGRKLEKK